MTFFMFCAMMKYLGAGRVDTMDALFLLEKLSQGASIQDILELGSKQIGNPMLICDSRFRILYMSKDDNLDVALWQRAKLDGYISDPVLADMKRESTLEKLMHTDEPIEADLPNGYHSFRVALRQRNSYCGFVGMYDYHHPFCEEDQRNLVLIAKALSARVCDHPDFRITNDTEWESLLFQLLCCQTKQQAKLAAERTHLPPVAKQMQLILMRPRTSSPLPLLRLKKLLCSLLPESVSVLHMDQIVLLMDKYTALSTLNSFCDMHNLTIGCSVPFTDLSFVPLAYAQGNACFHHGDSCSFDRIICQEIRHLCLTLQSVEYYVHPIFRSVEAYDKEYHLDYLRTLLVYLSHHGNLRSTADELGIHYNTMKHRLDVIESIAGVRIRDDDDLQQTLMASSMIVSEYYFQNRNI